MDREDKVFVSFLLGGLLLLALAFTSCNIEDTKRYAAKQETCNKAIETKDPQVVRDVCK
jgi:hypothetical protein